MAECTARRWSSRLVAVALAAWAAQAALAAQAAPAATQPTADEWVHTIVPGDTLLGLTARWLRPEARWQTLQKLNRIADPRRLTPGATLRIPVAMLREEAAQAEVMHSHGDVWLERAGAGRQPLKPATALLGGDVVLTGKQSSVSLRFADGTRTLVGPDSRLQLERLARLGPSGAVDSRVRLDNGSLETQVPPEKPPKRFEIRTPTANLGVRGTEFRSRIDGARTLAEVLQGRVAAGPQAVSAGFGVVATAGGVSAPRALPARPNLSALPDRLERVPLQLAIGREVGREIGREIGREAGLTRYRAQVFEADADDRLLLDGVFDQPFAQWPENLADGRYELRVRTLDAEGIEGLDGRKTFTLKARPEPPFLLRPRAGERLFDAAVTLAWSRNPDAATYTVQVSPNADFSPPRVERLGLSSVDIQLPLPLGIQHWRMAAVRADGDQGPWSDTRVFERAEPPPPPAAPTPQAPKASDEGLVLAWSASPMSGASYQLQVARDAAFTDTVLDLKTERTEALFPRPEPGTYHVRVRTLAADGRPGAYGSAQLIEVPRSWWWLWLLPLLLLL